MGEEEAMKTGQALEMRSEATMTEHRTSDLPVVTSPMAPPMAGFPVQQVHRRPITAPQLSPTSSPSVSPTSEIRVGGFWRDYATTRQAFASIQSELDSCSASLARMFRDLTG